MTNDIHDHGHHHGHGGTPTQILMAEHELILEALDALKQRVAAIYKIQGKTEESAKRILEEAHIIEDAGAFLSCLKQYQWILPRK